MYYHHYIRATTITNIVPAEKWNLLEHPAFTKASERMVTPIFYGGSHQTMSMMLDLHVKEDGVWRHILEDLLCIYELGLNHIIDDVGKLEQQLLSKDQAYLAAMRKVRIRFEKKWGIYHQMFERSYKRCNRSKADPWRRYGALRKLHEIGGTGRTLPNQDNSRVPQNFYQIEAGSIPPPPPTVPPITTVEEYGTLDELLTAKRKKDVNNERPMKRHSQAMLEVTTRHAQLAFYDNDEEDDKTN
ncbi:hypothetical protein KIN20_015486 [Parelaphostrongylus tenuis]|uniref:Uncharacterized protein n=1 Tax=Parelaphostrongylus tenuis TaxID=148309 RepID=A0AAD5MIK1_PARTN|nr:hypothetical protein KIN20_015486 [Parelaphostrongylus tenuis]